MLEPLDLLGLLLTILWFFLNWGPASYLDFFIAKNDKKLLKIKKNILKILR